MRLVYFSPLPWASFRQRPHEFAEWFHTRWQGPVLWVEPYPSRLPRWQDLSRPASRMPQAARAPGWLRVLRPVALPAEPLALGRAVNRALAWPTVIREVRAFAAAPHRTLLGIGKPSDLALNALERLPHLPSLYDAMDDFPAFHEGWAREACASIEKQIVSRTTLRSSSSSHLVQRMREQGAAGIHLVPNGLASGRLPVPLRPARGAQPARNFGYVGTVGPWFDWEWVARLATDWPDRDIEIHGPLYAPPTRPLPANVKLGPPLPHDQAIQRMASFAAGLIPFRATPLTESVDPVKFYEYRGLGLPVISTPFGEMRRHAHEPRVLLTADPIESHEAIAQLLGESDTLESMAAFRQHNDWSARFEPLAEVLDAMP